jgi:hypothetical protein
MLEKGGRVKLLYCTKCGGIFSICMVEKTCRCGESSGAYTDFLNAWYKGPCIPLGIANDSFTEAVRNQPNMGSGEEFLAFVIPKNCPTFVKLDI